MADAPKEQDVSGNNSRALLVSIVLFGTITFAQFLGGLVARSDALLIDCVSMLVDTLTYVVNLCAEKCHRDVADLTAAGISLIILLGVSVWGITEASMELQEEEPEEDLNPDIVLAFGIWGIVFDCLSCLGFFKWGLPGLLPRRSDRRYEEFEESLPAESCKDANGGSHSSQNTSAMRRTKSNTSAMNMRSAFMHVGADFLRSIVIVGEGVAVKVEGAQGRKTDSIAALIVSATIFLGACGAILPWIRQVLKWRRRCAAEVLESKSQSMPKLAPTSVGSIQQEVPDPSAV